jgi:hypothetical protein
VTARDADGWREVALMEARRARRWEAVARTLAQSLPHGHDALAAAMADHNLTEVDDI